ncbi:MAG: hypothetical protein U1F67_15900 [Rubrivivax sp.]
MGVVRLKQRLGLASWEFLREYAVPYEMEKDGIAIKLKPVEGGTACRFMTPKALDTRRPPDRLPLLPGGAAVDAPPGARPSTARATPTSASRIAWATPRTWCAASTSTAP